VADLIPAEQTIRWNQALAAFSRVDVCHLPEYHCAYALRCPGSQALLWSYECGGDRLCYPFLLADVLIDAPDGTTVATDYRDLSGIYGYSGPLATTADPAFLGGAWREFDEWARGERIICEFIRFSVFADNQRLAASDCTVLANRPVSWADLPSRPELYLDALDGKTRNMIRKAWKQGLRESELGVDQHLGVFRALYHETMERNQATTFFAYDDEYYRRLLAMGEKVVLCGVHDEDGRLVATAMGLIHGDMALYHLGASTREASRMGAGNLALYALATALIKRGVTTFNIGGGRTTAEDDPLFRFKKSCGTEVRTFHIGKRVIDPVGYDSLRSRWRDIHGGAEITSPNIQFYR